MLELLPLRRGSQWLSCDLSSSVRSSRGEGGEMYPIPFSEPAPVMIQTLPASRPLPFWRASCEVMEARRARVRACAATSSGD